MAFGAGCALAAGKAALLLYAIWLSCEIVRLGLRAGGATRLGQGILF